jgi:hypothetical protein
VELLHDGEVHETADLAREPVERARGDGGAEALLRIDAEVLAKLTELPTEARGLGLDSLPVARSCEQDDALDAEDERILGLLVAVADLGVRRPERARGRERERGQDPPEEASRAARPRTA